MASESDTDLLMRFILPGNKTVWAECSMKIAKSDTLINEDFFASDDLHEYTNYFQIDEFSFDLELDENPGGGSKRLLPAVLFLLITKMSKVLYSL